MANFLSIIELKERLHITFDDDDAELQGYLDAAESYLGDPQNGILWRPVIAQEFTEVFARFSDVEIAYPDGVDAVSVTYIDADGAEQTLGDIYTVKGGALCLKSGEKWPPHTGDVIVTYTSGWQPSDVPAGIKEAGYFIARSYYEQGHDIDQNRFRSVVAFMVAGYRRAGL